MKQDQYTIGKEESLALHLNMFKACAKEAVKAKDLRYIGRVIKCYVGVVRQHGLMVLIR